MFIRRINTADDIQVESQCLQHLPENHFVPILKEFQDHEDPQLTYIVMPFLRDLNDPAFSFVGDIVDLIDQLLEVSRAL